MTDVTDRKKSTRPSCCSHFVLSCLPSALVGASTSSRRRIAWTSVVLSHKLKMTFASRSRISRVGDYLRASSPVRPRSCAAVVALQSSTKRTQICACKHQRRSAEGRNSRGGCQCCMHGFLERDEFFNVKESPIT